MSRQRMPRLRGLSRGAVIVWISALLLTAFLPSEGDDGDGRVVALPPDSCIVKVMRDELKAGKSSAEIMVAVQAQCKEAAGEGGEPADNLYQPAGENWLMRRLDALKEEMQRDGYAKIRRLFVAADQLQDYPARVAAFRRILQIADSPLVRHRTYIEIAHSALRSGSPEARRDAAEAADAAQKEVHALPKEARADVHLVYAELAFREGKLKQSLEQIALALENDRRYLAAHILRLNAIVAIAPQLGDDDKTKIHYLNQGIVSAYFVRRLTERSYVVDARSAIAEHPLQSDVAALLQFYLGTLADDRDGARRAMAAFIKQCVSGGLSCSDRVRARALGLLE